MLEGQLQELQDIQQNMIDNKIIKPINKKESPKSAKKSKRGTAGKQKNQKQTEDQVID